MVKDIFAFGAIIYFIIFICVWAPSIADVFAR